MRENAASAAPASATYWGRRDDLIAIVLLTLFVTAIYGVRLSLQPLVGEETRWATGAREMLATGDWLVPRQQGHIFPERPPMTMWTMAVAGWLCGEVDALAVRLPSVIAIVLTSVLVYCYTRVFASVTAATVAAIAYATFGQVLQIGRHGESEALFALLVAASLLVWHVGYMQGWRPLVVWMIGFALAGLAALVKGPQAPVYFVVITGMYLAVRFDWRYLLSWQYAVGATVFVAIIAIWQVPFYFATDWSAVMAIWSGLAGDRFQLGGFLAHIVSYPAETFACLLPWSLILVTLAKRETRLLLADQHVVLTFLATAILVAYPTVWLAAGARGRYFMPIYPLVAVLIGLVIERCAAAAIGTYPRRAWHQFLLLWGTLIVGAGVVICIACLLMQEPSQRFYQPTGFGVAFATVTTLAAFGMWHAYRRPHQSTPLIAAGAIATVAGIAAAGLVVNVHLARWIDPTNNIAKLRHQLPPDANLVSFSPIEHRFAYYYGDSITELDWPQAVNELPADAEYFCFMRTPGDTASSRSAGRGRTWYKTSGTLPFAWEEIASVCVERQVYDDSPRTVVVGRVVRPMREEISDVSKPQISTVGNLRVGRQSRQSK